MNGMVIFEMGLIQGATDVVSDEELLLNDLIRQCQDLLLKTFDVVTLKVAFTHILDCVMDSDMPWEDIPNFNSDIKITIENHCIDIARDFEEETGLLVEDECDSMLRWLDFLTGFAEKYSSSNLSMI